MITNVLDTNINNIDAQKTTASLISFAAGLALVLGIVLLIVGIFDYIKYQQDDSKKKSALLRLLVGSVLLLFAVIFFVAIK
jgi:uncharacterized membrane protein HdeD (DUF308 family)